MEAANEAAPGKEAVLMAVAEPVAAVVETEASGGGSCEGGRKWGGCDKVQQNRSKYTRQYISHSSELTIANPGT